MVKISFTPLRIIFLIWGCFDLFVPVHFLIFFLDPKDFSKLTEAGFLRMVLILIFVHNIHVYKMSSATMSPVHDQMLLDPGLSWWSPSQSLAASFQSCDVSWHPRSASLSLHSSQEFWLFCQNFCPFSFCWQHLCPADDEYLWTVCPQCRVRNVMKFYQNVRYGMLTVCWYFAVFLVIIMEGENVVAVEYSKVPFCCCRPDFSFEKRFWSGQTALSTVELMNGAICLFSVGRYGQCVQMIHLLLPWFAVLLSCVLTMSSVNSGSAALWCPLLLISLQRHSD